MIDQELLENPFKAGEKWYIVVKVEQSDHMNCNGCAFYEKKKGNCLIPDDEVEIDLLDCTGDDGGESIVFKKLEKCKGEKEIQWGDQVLQRFSILDWKTVPDRCYYCRFSYPTPEEKEKFCRSCNKGEGKIYVIVSPKNSVKPGRKFQDPPKKEGMGFEPFTLEEALRNPERIYTRDGRKVRYFQYSKNSHRLFAYVPEYEGAESIRVYDRNGKLTPQSDREDNGLDLVLLPFCNTVKKWVKVCKTKNGDYRFLGPYNSQEEALDTLDCSQGDTIVCTEELVWEE